MATSPSTAPEPADQPLLRLSLSALDQASEDPAIWRRAEVHQAVLVSGLSTFVAAIVTLRRDLEQAA
jgi:hypothetical protein